uniref:Glycosyl transferase n=1 Tax=Strongyloides papillosus TaxID=174720 RepID=A0A0N5BJV6_STREA
MDSFSGEKETFPSYLQKINAYCRLSNIPDNQKLDTLIVHLRGRMMDLLMANENAKNTFAEAVNSGIFRHTYGWWYAINLLYARVLLYDGVYVYTKVFVKQKALRKLRSVGIKRSNPIVRLLEYSTTEVVGGERIALIVKDLEIIKRYTDVKGKLI